MTQEARAASDKMLHEALAFSDELFSQREVRVFLVAQRIIDLMTCAETIDFERVLDTSSQTA